MLVTAWQGVGRAAQWGLSALVRAYRFWFKPWLGNTCRYAPTCSVYALQALKKHGAARGAALAGWRVLRCNPWCEGGCDDVPDVWTSAWSTIAPHTSNAQRGLFTALVPTDAPAAPADVAPTNRKST